MSDTVCQSWLARRLIKERKSAWTSLFTQSACSPNAYARRCSQGCCRPHRKCPCCPALPVCMNYGVGKDDLIFCLNHSGLLLFKPLKILCIKTQHTHARTSTNTHVLIVQVIWDGLEARRVLAQPHRLLDDSLTATDGLARTVQLACQPDLLTAVKQKVCCKLSAVRRSSRLFYFATPFLRLGNASEQGTEPDRAGSPSIKSQPTSPCAPPSVRTVHVDEMLLLVDARHLSECSADAQIGKPSCS